MQQVGKKDGGALSFGGSVHMLDYMAQQPITLHVRAVMKTCSSEHTVILFQISPAAEQSPIRKKLREIADGFRCKG